MPFKKKTHLAGLDIGSRSIKAAEVVKSRGGYSLKNFGMIDLPLGIIEDGAIKEPEKVTEAIRELFKINRFKIKNVAISIGGYSVIVKKINVQSMPEDLLQETIHLEAEQYIPFDINEVNLDFQILGENENNPNQMGVLLVAAKKDMIDEYVNIIEMAGLNPSLVDVDAFALQNVFELNYDVAKENVALVDIGAGKASLNILKGGVSEFIRDISFGCDQINEEIMAQFGYSFEESEELKRNQGADEQQADQIQKIVNTIAADWCSEIRRALDFFYSSYPDDRINRILLSGGGARIKVLQQLLATETSSEIATLNPLNNLKIENRRIDISEFKQIAPQAAICIGLAVRRVDDK